MEKRFTIQKIHIFVIIIGMLFTIIPCFHSNLWFDESYSVALASHPFTEIWNIDIHDVHPVFYYDCLHLLYLVFGNNIVVYRLFSWSCLSILGIFGYTHIRKTLNEKMGLLFSFFVFFFPLNIVYGSEVRMYMLVMLLVTIGTYNAYFISISPNQIQNHLGMMICFILSAYTHYYGLLAAACVNLLLLIHYIIHHKKYVKYWFLDGIIQIGCYLPWIFVFLAQTMSVKESFWIYWQWPWSYINTFLFIFSGNLEKEVFISPILVIIYAAILIGYIYFTIKKNKTNIHFVQYTIGIYLSVILIACIASLMMMRAVFYARYLLVCHGLLLLFLAYSFSLKNLDKTKKHILSITVCMAIIANISVCQTNYDSSNKAPVTYLRENMKEGDVILVSNYQHDPNSFVLVSQLSEYPLIYFNECKWSQESILAYQAYGKDMKVIDSLEELKEIPNRIWVVYGDDEQMGRCSHVLDEVSQAYHKSVQQQEYFQTKYKNIEYTIGLIS